MSVRITLVVMLVAVVVRASDDIPDPLPPLTESPSTLRAIRIETDLVKVDGILDEEVWEQAESLTIGWETWPAHNEPFPVRAEGLVAYDLDKIYFGFRAYDPEPTRIRARYTDRDHAFDDDFIGVVLDTFNDERRAFEFFVNPVGVQMDLVIDDVGDREDSSWDAIWHSAGRVTSFGYTVEMAIPFSSLRFAAREGSQTWGIDMVRIYPRDQRYSIRPQHRDWNLSCYLCQVSKLEGLEGLEQGKSIELDPTFTAQRTDTRDDGSLESGDVATDLGLTLHWGVTPNITLNAALNPDFSQIEADAAQLDINNTFALFFPEKRPFFLEGDDFFNTPLDVVHTRTVADPDWGAKVTGKQGRSAIGAHVVGDAVTNLLIPGSQGSALASLEEENLAAVLRYRYDVGASSTLGFLYTGRDGESEYNNHVAGIDALWRFNESDSLSGQILGSSTRYPTEIVREYDQPSGSFEDVALRLRYHHDSSDLWWNVRIDDIGRDFRADSGFMPRVDYRFAIAGGEKIFHRASDDFVSTAYFGGDVDYTEDHSGQKLELEYQLWTGARMPRQTFVWTTVGTRERTYNGSAFDEVWWYLWIQSRPTGSTYVALEVEGGDDIDFANTRAGNRLRLSPEITWKPGRRTELSLEHTYSRLDVAGGRLFEANLTELRAVYQFNLRMFVRAILQYTDITRNRDLYVDEVDARSRHLFPQFLFSYKLTPQTVFFAGYSDNRVGEEGDDLTQRDRTFFTKIGYAWLF